MKIMAVRNYNGHF